MKLSELITGLQARPELTVVLTLPDGTRVPPHYHVTEVGHVAKKFVDCGGTFRASETCVLQAHVGTARDDGHRLTAGKLAKILGLAQSILSDHALPVEVEYEDDVISQYPLAAVAAKEDALVLQLGPKHTDCLAKDKCGIDDGCGDGPREAVGCCGGTGGCC